MLTILTTWYLKAKADAVGLHHLLRGHPLLALPCWTLGSTSIHLTLPVWTTVTLGRLSASLIGICAERLPPIKFTCRRPRWRSTKEENTTFRHVSASAETCTKSCLPNVRFRWTLHDILLWSSASWKLSPTTAATHALVSLGRTLR